MNWVDSSAILRLKKTNFFFSFSNCKYECQKRENCKMWSFFPNVCQLIMSDKRVEFDHGDGWTSGVERGHHINRLCEK